MSKDDFRCLASYFTVEACVGGRSWQGCIVKEERAVLGEHKGRDARSLVAQPHTGVA